MADSLAGVVLAAGTGTRLRPLTLVRPKPMCPVVDVPLVDLAIARVEALTPAIAVNTHHLRALLETHLAGRVHLSSEVEEPLGTAGALGRLRPWIDGRPTLVVNSDTWCPGSLQPLADGWDGERIRVLLAGSDPFGPRARIAGALMPWSDVAPLADAPSGLWEASWHAALDAGRVEVVTTDAPFIDCGTPGAYLAANLAANGGVSVVGRGAVVEGELVRSVVWPGGVVWPGERLVDAIRVGRSMTVLVR